MQGISKKLIKKTQRNIPTKVLNGSRINIFRMKLCLNKIQQLNEFRYNE